MQARCGPDFEVTNNPQIADVLVLNSCTVRGEGTALLALRKLNRVYPGTPVIVAGCVTPSLATMAKEVLPSVSFMNTHGLGSIQDSLRLATSGSSADSRGIYPLNKVLAPKVRRNGAVGIIQCASGCESSCAFCSTRLIKGKTKSYAPNVILDEVRRCVSDGCKEIWLTATDLGCYGVDIGTNLPELVRQVAEVNGKFIVRIGMANPAHVMQYAQQFAEVLQHPKVFKFAHLPHQSGSDRVLNLMKRGYTFAQYLTLVKSLVNTVKNLTLSTDIIVGFPGETASDFEQTLDSVRVLQPDVCNIARFVARPGTRAATMPLQVPGAVKKARSLATHNVFREHSLKKNRAWIGWEGSCIVEEEGRHNCVVVRNDAYKPIIVREKLALGNRVTIRVVEATSIDLRAVLTSDL